MLFNVSRVSGSSLEVSTEICVGPFREVIACRTVTSGMLQEDSDPRMLQEDSDPRDAVGARPERHPDVLRAQLQ